MNWHLSAPLVSASILFWLSKSKSEEDPSIGSPPSPSSTNKGGIAPEEGLPPINGDNLNPPIFLFPSPSFTYQEFGTEPPVSAPLLFQMNMKWHVPSMHLSSLFETGATWRLCTSKQRGEDKGTIVSLPVQGGTCSLVLPSSPPPQWKKGDE